MSEMPYVRGAGCDLCGVRAPLHRVELSPASRKKRARVVYICDAHGDPSDCLSNPQQEVEGMSQVGVEP